MSKQLSDEVDFQAVFESAPCLFLLLTPNFTIIDASDQYLAATMVKRENIIGRGLFEVFPDNPDDPTTNGSLLLQASLERVLSNRQPDVMAIQKYDVRRPEPDGGGFEERYWSPLNVPVLNSDGTIKYIIHRVEDVTDFVRLKREKIEQYKITEEIRTQKDELEKLRQSQRMESMGALAGGVAHDFNNILGAILMTCENALSTPGLPEAVQNDLKQILIGSERAATLTRQLLAFSRKQILQPKILNLNTVVENLKEFLSRLLKENIKLNISLAKELGNILADQGQIEQVILNLVVNARDAIPSGGTITIELGNVVLDKAMSHGNMKIEPGNFVMLAVRDTGIGMDAKTQARLFEPFFTTKATGKGTGLGLATVYGIVNQSKGSIWVYSELGKGAVFKVYFPIVEQTAEAPIQSTESRVLPVIAQRSILVVEDQEPLRKVICTVLKEHGYQVHSAENGVRALAILEDIKYQIDLIITDVIMPEMGGQELERRLVSLGHKFKFLYLSGFSGDILINYNNSASNVAFLEKPFRKQILLEKVSELLS